MPTGDPTSGDQSRGGWRNLALHSLDFSLPEALFIVLIAGGLLIFGLTGPGGVVAGLGAAIPAGLAAGIFIGVSRRRRHRKDG